MRLRLLGDVTPALLNQCQDLCRQGVFHSDALLWPQCDQSWETFVLNIHL